MEEKDAFCKNPKLWFITQIVREQGGRLSVEKEGRRKKTPG